MSKKAHSDCPTRSLTLYVLVCLGPILFQTGGINNRKDTGESDLRLIKPHLHDVFLRTVQCTL